jgi:hypothetical protein
VDGGATWVSAVAVDPAGNIYLAGTTQDATLPVTPGAVRTEPPFSLGRADFTETIAFLMELSPAGDRLLYATYYGSGMVGCFKCNWYDNDDYTSTAAFALAIGPSGQVAMAGTAGSCPPITAGVHGNSCYDVINHYVGFVAVFAAGNPLKLSWCASDDTSAITSDLLILPHDCSWAVKTE